MSELETIRADILALAALFDRAVECGEEQARQTAIVVSICEKLAARIKKLEATAVQDFDT